jgi:hypothetical protein
MEDKQKRVFSDPFFPSNHQKALFNDGNKSVSILNQADQYENSNQLD